MKKLFVYLKDYRKESVLGPLFKLLEATFELIVPLVVAAIIDTGIGSGDKGYILRMCLVLVALGLVGLLCSVTAQYFAAKASVGFVTRLRHVLYRHLQGFSYQTLDQVGISTLITRMTSDMNQVQTGLNLALRLLLRSPFVVFGAMIIAFTIDSRAALWFAAAIPALSLVVFSIMLVTMPLYKKVQGLLDKVLGATRENLTGVRVLRAFGKEDAEIDAFEQKNEALTVMQKHVGRISALMNPVTYVIINVAILCLIHTGALRVEAGIITQGAVVALYNYMSQILVELIKLANLIITITKSLASLKRIQGWVEIDGTWEVKDAPIQNPYTAQTAYEISHCMTCGCCLEACPNVGPQSDFIGPAPTVQAYLFNLHPLGKFDAPKRLNALMAKGGITSCGNSQNCVEVCPKNIKLTTYLAQLNRDVNKQALKNIFNH